MDHISFRFYIPGIVFLIPIYLAGVWNTVSYSDKIPADTRTFILVGCITTFPAIALPIGWWVYNIYRVWWIKWTKGGYENKDFITLIRKDTKPFYSPITGSILIDLTRIQGIKKWIEVDLEIFRKVFYPFTSKKKFNNEIKKTGVNPKFYEPLSDFILMKDHTYEYARSISSIRYGLESGLFALILGCLYACTFHFIFHAYVIDKNHGALLIFWIVVLTLLTLFIGYSLFIRWKYADKEYDARLILATLTTLAENQFDMTLFTNNIPEDIFDNINQISLPGKPYAAFDLDNTLLIDDIGEAVFAYLLKNKMIDGFTWKDYLDLLQKDRLGAYKRVINVMAGMNIKQVEEITHDIINSRNASISIEGEQIPVPRPNPVMQSIISFLKAKGVDVYVVTASNKISAEIVCWKFFGIPSGYVLGADVIANKHGIISHSSHEIPFAEGKVKALQLKLGDKQPVMTGGDGAWDKFLLDYTTPNGVRLWLGQSSVEYQQMKKSHYKDLKFYHISR